ncbi:cysteine proteinase [Trametopsis cervina]|nr:cysteine proteinase [Trametopsis cervina]
MKKWTLFSTVQSPAGPAASPEQEAVQAITAADAKMFGFENFGNTCYANSVLQALYFCGPFRDLLVQYPDPSNPDIPPIPVPISVPAPAQNHQRPKPGRQQSISDVPSLSNCSPSTTVTQIPNAPPTLLSALRSLYVHISRNPAEKGTVAPRAFIEKLKELNELFRGTIHQDAHEFLNFLLNRIVEEMDEDRKRFVSEGAHTHSNGNGAESITLTPSGEDLSASVGSMAHTATTGTHYPIPDSVKSTLVHRLFEVSSRDESFLDLSIDIEQNSSVTACLRQFSASEMLCQRNKFFCDSCCDLQEAEKRMKIKKLPNILALHLKRFKYQEDVGKYIKLAYRVAFPLELRLFNTTDGTANPDRLYELFAIVVHIGNGPHHGHYVSIVKARNTWYLFDDDKIEAIKEAEIPKYFGDSNSGQAYVLYYQAADLDFSALGLRSAEPEPSTTAISSNLASSSSLSGSSALTPTAEAGEYESAAANSPIPVPLPPSIPPGLSTDNGQDGDPAASISSSPAQAPPDHQPHRPRSQTGLKLSLPPREFTEPGPSSPTAPPTPSASTARTFFIRHTPSLRIRPSTSSGTSDRKSVVDVPPVPPVPGNANHVAKRPATAGNAETPSSPEVFSAPLSPPSISASPSISTSGSHSKEKEKPGPSYWFKPKTFRADKSPVAAFDVGTGYVDELGGAKGSKPSKRVSRRASDAVLASPFASSPPALFSPMPASLRPLAEQKHLTPDLPMSPKPEKRSLRQPQRPSTAGAVSERPMSELSPLPPLPPLPAFHSSQPHRDQSFAAHSSPTNDADPIAKSSSSSSSAPTTQTSSTHAGLPSSGTNGTSSSLTTTVEDVVSGAPASVDGLSSLVPTAKPKRASRKLSFSLGFGRKDKEKDSHKHRPQSPAYSQTSSQGTGYAR